MSGGGWGEQGDGEQRARAARAEQRAGSSARGEQRVSMVFPLTRRMSRIKFPIRDRFHEIEFADGGKPSFLLFFCGYFMQSLRKRKKASSGTQKPKCGALAPALVHQPTPQKKGRRARHGASTKHTSPPKKSPKKHKAIRFLIAIVFVAVDSGALGLCVLLVLCACAGGTKNARLLVFQNHRISLRDIRLRQPGLVQTRWGIPARICAPLMTVPDEKRDGDTIPVKARAPQHCHGARATGEVNRIQFVLTETPVNA